MMAALRAVDRWLAQRSIMLLLVAAGFLAVGLLLADSIVKTGIIMCATCLIFSFLMRSLFVRFSDASFFSSTLLLALVVKIIILLVISSHVHFDDETGIYDRVGWQKAQEFRGEGPSVQMPEDIRAYGYTVAAIYSVVGHLPLIPRFANVLFGILLSWIVARVAALFFDERTSRIAWVLMLLFPSMLLWSSTLLRDTLIICLTTLGLACASLFLRRPLAAPFVGCMASIAVLVLFRSYSAVLLLASVLPFMAIALGRTRPRLLISLGVLCLLLGLLLLPAIPDAMLEKLSLEKLQHHRIHLAVGGSAFGVDDDVSTMAGLLEHLPTGFGYFLFAPFPLSVSSVLEALTGAYILALYACMLFALFALPRLSREQALVLAPAFAFFILFATFSAIIEGNVGTAMRHRAQIEPIILLLASVSIARLYTKN